MSSAGRVVTRAPRPPNITNKYSGTLKHEHLPCSPVDLTFEPILALLCAMYIVFGIFYMLFGYRCFKASMFLTGFTFGSIIVYLICLQEYLLPPYGNVCVAVCAGLLFGLITMLIQYMGLFMTGFHTGVLVAISGLSVYDQFVDHRPQTYLCCIFTLLGTGIFFAVINLYWKKALTIFGTSMYGGAVIATSIDYFLERLLMVHWLWQRVKLEMPVSAPCGTSWVALAAWPATALVGLVVQCTLTATGIHHEQSIRAQKRSVKAHQSRPIMTREQRAEMKEQKYRYLYQVRTAHGDVISQSYVKALQKRAQCNHWNCADTGSGSGSGSGHGHGGAAGLANNGTMQLHGCPVHHGAGTGTGGGECSTLQSDSTHLTVLASDHHLHTDSEDDLDQIHVLH